MKSAVQPISRESSRPDSDLAIVIQLPQPSQQSKDVSNGQTVQWQWDYNFSVSFTAGVFEPKPINVVKQDDGLYLTTPPLRVVGPPNNVSICTYTSLPDASSIDIDPPPPPPPNVIIVDNSAMP